MCEMCNLFSSGSDECHCECHTHTDFVKHIMPCCIMCPGCGKERIVNWIQHVKECEYGGERRDVRRSMPQEDLVKIVETLKEKRLEEDRLDLETGSD